MRRFLFLIACVAVPLRALDSAAAGVLRPDRQPRRASSTGVKIDRTQERDRAKKAREDAVQRHRRVHPPHRRLQSRITTVAGRQAVLQEDLDAKRAELAACSDLRAERARLVRLRARLRETRTMLRKRLVELFKADKPDVLTVVLELDGFADLLERTEFIRRISDQDRRIVVLVRDARRGDRHGGEARQARVAPEDDRRRRQRGATRSPR